jgi:four helix bundle protein
MAFKFEKLDVWKDAIELTGMVDGVACRFPKRELYVLSTQIRRVADSVALNVAEGSTGQSDPEFRKFLGYSSRSGIEIISCIYIARRRQIITEHDFVAIYNFTEVLLKRIQALRKAI